MPGLLVLTDGPPAQVLPALELLPYRLLARRREALALVSAPPADLIVLDARTELPAARALARLLRATGPGAPLLGVFDEGGLAALSTDWGLDDAVLTTAGPAEVAARIRLAIQRAGAAPSAGPRSIRRGGLVIDESSYSCRLDGRALDLTFTEFELLRFLAEHAGRVFTRAQLLAEVWGDDYYGGTRTVDVHVRRLRAKLGREHESLIGTVRQVGYRFVDPDTPGAPDARPTSGQAADPVTR